MQHCPDEEAWALILKHSTPESLAEEECEAEDRKLDIAINRLREEMSKQNLYFMMINNVHHNEASITNLGTHEEDATAIEYADECIQKMLGLELGWDHKIYKVEGDKIRELDIHEEYYPPIELLDKGVISWLFDSPSPR